jgi:chromosome condensin MukBEF ATPase and DNA-binding subunit MukB
LVLNACQFTTLSQAIVEELQTKVEEAELAAAVQTRRASHAEAEVALLREQLADAQKQVCVQTGQCRCSLNNVLAIVQGGHVCSHVLVLYV